MIGGGVPPIGWPPDPAILPIVAGVVAAWLTAAFVKGATGLGFSTTCLPLMVLSVGLEQALALVLIPSLASNAIVLVGTGSPRATLRRFWPLYLAQAPGILLGLWLLTVISGARAAAVLGVVLVVYALIALGRPPRAPARRLADRLRVPTGLATGTVNGLTGSQVMPVLPYLLALQLSPSGFVQAINLSFTWSSLLMLAGLARLEILTPTTALISLAGLLPVALGVRFGALLRGRLTATGFRRLVLLTLAALGLLLIGRAVL